MLRNQRTQWSILCMLVSGLGLSMVQAGDCVRCGTEVPCSPNTPTFGFWPTQWRRFPGANAEPVSNNPRRDGFNPPSYQRSDPVHEADPPRSSLERPTGPSTNESKGTPTPPAMGLPDKLLPSGSGVSPLRPELDGRRGLEQVPNRPMSQTDLRDGVKTAAGSSRRNPHFPDIVPSSELPSVVPASLQTSFENRLRNTNSPMSDPLEQNETIVRSPETGSDGDRTRPTPFISVRPNPLRGN